MKSIFAILVVGLIPLTASADDWLVRKNRGNGNCYVQLIVTGTEAPANVVSTHPSRKEACDAAKALATGDGTTAATCAAYTPNSVTECKKEGVDLP